MVSPATDSWPDYSITLVNFTYRIFVHNNKETIAFPLQAFVSIKIQREFTHIDTRGNEPVL